MAKRRKIKRERRVEEREEERKPIIEYKPPSEEERRVLYREGLVKTFLSSILGVIAGVISVELGSSLLIVVGLLIVFTIVQYPIYTKIGMKMKEFGKKDWFYVGFMTFDFWLITSVLMMN